MTVDQVAQAAGPADDERHDQIVGVTLERRGSSEFEYDDDTGTVHSIYTFRPGRGRAIRRHLGGAPYVPLVHDGIEILDDDGFADLSARERTVEGRGGLGVLFPDLGLVVVGFRKRVPEGRYAIAFSREKLGWYEEGWLAA
jgi:hypothetical protein